MPCPPQAGDLKHLAIPQRQLGEPWLNRSSLSKKNRNSSKLEIPVLINASTTTGSRLKFVPSAFRESSILEDSLGTRLKELATPSLGSLPTRLSQSCTLGGVPLLLHNDRGRDETGDGGGEGGRTDRTAHCWTCILRLVNSPDLTCLPTWVCLAPPLRTVFSVRLVKLATGNGSLHGQKGASCSYASLCDRMKTGATTS